MLRTSESIDAFAPAFASAQAEILPVPKDKVNPHFKSRYSDLSTVREACREPLKKYDLSVIQAPGFVEGRVRITTRILHKSGQWIESDLDLKTRNDTAQDAGSAITYGRRYALAAMLGVVSEEDDDGNAASGSRPVHKQGPNSQPHGPVNQPSPQSTTVLFDHGNSEHMKRLSSLLSKKNIAPDFYPEFANLLHGKPMLEKTVDDIIRDIDAETAREVSNAYKK